jgi:hypothetical protein
VSGSRKVLTSTASVPVRLALASMACFLAIAAPARATTFTDVTATALPGLPAAPPAFFAAAVAVGDYDNDGWEDIFVGAGGPEGSRLFRNLHDGTFEDVTEAAGLVPSTFVLTLGGAWGDVDRDGDLDLFVSGNLEQRHFLYINNGQGSFTEEAVNRGVAVVGAGTRVGWIVSFGDFDNDGYLDIYLPEVHSEEFNPDAVGPYSRLFRNRGAVAPGHFEDVTSAAGVIVDEIPGTPDGTHVFVGRFSDLDADGFADLVLASDFGESRLFWNDGNGTFTDGSEAAGYGAHENGMGAAIGDYDGDGLLDVFIVSNFFEGFHGPTGNGLYRGLGARGFSNQAVAAGVEDGGWGWGAEFFDYDNDGDLDLALTNGADFDPDDPMIDPERNEFLQRFRTDPLRFWVNDGDGTFSERAEELGFIEDGITRGMVPFDYDKDGDLDVIIGRLELPPILFRNDIENAGDWLNIRSPGIDSNADGIGIRVEVTTVAGGPVLLRETSGSSSYLGQYSGRVLHVGLGANSEDPVHKVAVSWPATGRHKVFHNVQRNSVLVASEPDGSVTTTTTSSSTTTTLLSGCGQSPRLDCVAYRRGFLSIDEREAGQERLRLIMRRPEPALTAATLGDPLEGSTRYEICFHAGVPDSLVAEITLDRAGQLCRSRPCWRPKESGGLIYKDPKASADGVRKLVARGQVAGRRRLSVKARNNQNRSMVHLQTGIAAALGSAEGAIVQILTDDAGCVGINLTAISTDDGTFQARVPLP